MSDKQLALFETREFLDYCHFYYDDVLTIGNKNV